MSHLRKVTADPGNLAGEPCLGCGDACTKENSILLCSGNVALGRVHFGNDSCLEAALSKIAGAHSLGLKELRLLMYRDPRQLSSCGVCYQGFAPAEEEIVLVKFLNQGTRTQVKCVHRRCLQRVPSQIQVIELYRNLEAVIRGKPPRYLNHLSARRVAELAANVMAQMSTPRSD